MREKGRTHGTTLPIDDSDYFIQRCKDMGITPSAAIRECLEHCGMLPRKMADLKAKAYAIGAAMLPAIHSPEFVNRKSKYGPPSGVSLWKLKKLEPSLRDLQKQREAETDEEREAKLEAAKQWLRENGIAK